jgi:hypothetical protein
MVVHDYCPNDGGKLEIGGLLTRLA